MVKVERKYLFAGEEVSEIVEVPEDSLEAKKWPLFKDPGSEPAKVSEGEAIASIVSEDSSSRQGSSSVSVEPTQSDSTATNPISVPKPAAKRPGPRKSKISLAPLPGASKPKKLTTLDKSAMDWKSHLQAEQAAGSSITDELAANRKGGGYLEKVEFLKRVEERKDETLESLKSSKRRRL
ncbi:bucentaur or craniofacial development-domain-containing protein [Pholiota molesta]|nr:bucentaur or craniofacial development-domain-containing protein [Pholiota molesta]